MNKTGYNRKKAKEAAKKPFRLEEDIYLSASDRHSDSYRILITARPLRDKFNVHLIMSHEPSQKTVYSKTWLFNAMETCWDKFYTIADIAKGVRDFVETEGIQTITAQYMLKHNLSVVGADIENIYEKAVPYWQEIKDESSRGNLLQNHPLVPVYVQSGPDSLPDVYRSTGAFKNPVPEGYIKEPYVPEHLRKPKGIQANSPMSGFQAAALHAGIPISRSASSEKMTKTASPDFLRSIEENSKEVARKAKRAAIEHYKKVKSSSDLEASGFYDRAKALFSDQKVAVDMPLHELMGFLDDGVYAPQNHDKKTYNSRKAKQIGAALGLGYMPVRGAVRRKIGGRPDLYTVVCSVGCVPMAMFNGSLDRLRNPARQDYAPVAADCLMSVSDAQDCRTAAAIMALSIQELAGGTDRALDILANKEFGKTEALLMGPLETRHIEAVVTGDEEKARQLRDTLDKIGKIVPVLCENSVDEVDPASDIEDEEALEAQGAEQGHFNTSDRVSLKAHLNNPSIQGTITDTSNGRVSVQWDHGERHVYDMAEALMRLMTLPGGPDPIEGSVVYSLPGMDDDSVMALNALQIDPVTVHALVSHARPAAESVKGWEEALVNSFRKLGLNLRKVEGFAHRDQQGEAFEPRSWFEARLRGGTRLVIDLAAGRMNIRAGASAEDYVEPLARIAFE